MANTKFSDLTTYILPELPGCSDPLAEQQIRATVIDFCTRSKIWRVIQDPVDMLAYEPQYDLDLPANTALVQVLSCTINGVGIDPSSTDQLDLLMPTWQTQTGTPKWFLQLDPTTFLLAPVPQTTLASGISMMLALKPSRTAVSFPDWIADQYIDAIASGAKARMMRQAGRTWSNPQQSMLEQMMFDEAVAAANQAAAGSLVRTAQRTISQH